MFAGGLAFDCARTLCRIGRAVRQPAWLANKCCSCCCCCWCGAGAAGVAVLLLLLLLLLLLPLLPSEVPVLVRWRELQQHDLDAWDTCQRPCAHSCMDHRSPFRVAVHRHLASLLLVAAAGCCWLLLLLLLPLQPQGRELQVGTGLAMFLTCARA